MTQAEEALVRLEMVQSDLYCKIILMQVQGLDSMVVTEMDMACQLGLVRAAMVHLGDQRDYGPYPQTHPLIKDRHANKTPDRH